MLAQARADTIQQRAAAAAPSSSRTAALAGEQDQGYWQYMQKQLSERTEKLGSVNDGMNSLEQTTGNWLGDVNKFVSQQKKNAVTGSKFFFLLFLSLWEERMLMNCLSSHQIEIRILRKTSSEVLPGCMDDGCVDGWK
jgi:hypothetical protein